MKKLQLTKIIIFLLTISLAANATIEEGENCQNLVRGPLVLKDPATLYDQSGITFINSTGNPATGISLTRNDTGDLLWNGNFIQKNGQLNLVNLKRSVNEPGPVFKTFSTGSVGRVLVQNAFNKTDLVDAPLNLSPTPIIAGDPIAPMLVLTPDNGVMWLYLRTSTVTTDSANSNCDLACKAQSQIDDSSAPIATKVYSNFCVSARENTRPVGCTTPAGTNFGQQNTCTCIGYTSI